MTLRRFLRVFFVVLCALSLLVGAGNFPSFIGDGIGATHAFAAEKEKRKNIFQLLFGKREKKTAPKKKVRKKKKKRVAKRRVKTSVIDSSKAVIAVKKSETAQHVLVVGDFVAGSLSEGLVESYAGSAGVIVDERSNGSSGLVRDDYFNWPEKIGTYIDELKPSVVVIALGSNDRQSMRINGKSEKTRSAAWEAEYVKRVDALIRAIRKTNTPVMWMGSPPYKFSKMSADIIAFNEIYRREVTSNGGSFVDVWNGFVDQDGNFVFSGSDIKGQDARLRANDGINFTQAGKRKLAFYVERQLRPLLSGASPALASFDSNGNSLKSLPPLESEADLVRTNPISFEDPELDGGSALLGDADMLSSRVSTPLKTKSFRQRLVEDGVPAPSHKGRANNFSWPG